MRNNYLSATKLIGAAIREIGSRLPPWWLLLNRERISATRSQQEFTGMIDAVWELRAPDGLSSDVIVEVKMNPVEPRMVGNVTSRLKELSSQKFARAGVAPACVLVSPYLSLLTRERLAEAGIGYADSTGNIRFTVDRPAVFIETRGADQNPFREDRPLRSIKGRSSARVVRGLMDYWPPFGTRELAARIASPPAMISRVSSLLELDDIVTKDGPRGRIISVDWEALARRWATDYGFSSSNALTTWLEPRGTRELFDRLRGCNFRFAVTGSFASHRLAPVAEPRLAALYVNDPETVAQSLGLRPADTGANVLLVRPCDPVVFERAEYDDGITYTRATQVLLDVMTGPGRGPAEAEALLEWMRGNEEKWKLSTTEST